MTQTSWSRAACRAQFQPTPGSEPRWGSQANAVIRTFSRRLAESRLKSGVLVPDVWVSVLRTRRGWRTLQRLRRLDDAVGFLAGGSHAVPVLRSSPFPQVCLLVRHDVRVVVEADAGAVESLGVDVGSAACGADAAEVTDRVAVHADVPGHVRAVFARAAIARLHHRDAV